MGPQKRDERNTAKGAAGRQEKKSDPVLPDLEERDIDMGLTSRAKSKPNGASQWALDDC